jgi:hypothetical protein
LHLLLEASPLLMCVCKVDGVNFKICKIEGKNQPTFLSRIMQTSALLRRSLARARLIDQFANLKSSPRCALIIINSMSVMSNYYHYCKHSEMEFMGGTAAWWWRVCGDELSSGSGSSSSSSSEKKKLINF